MKITPLDPWIAARTGTGSQVIRAELEAYQLGRLNDTLALVSESSRFYRGRLPQALSRLDDLADLPFTTAEDLRTDPLRFVCGSQGRINRIVTLDTSGTTGRPKRIAFTAEDQELTIDFFSVGMSTFTRPGDRVAILLPGEAPGTVGDLLATALLRLGAIPLQHGPVFDAATSRQRLVDDEADVAVGVPTHLLAIARQRGTQPALRDVLASTDHLPNAIVQAVESAWGCTVYDHYGMTEMGLGGGVECEAREGYHMREADMIFEVVDPRSGDPVAGGDWGEAVFTTITRSGMPLIRYRTGDITRFLPGTCHCSSTVRRLQRLQGRLDGTVEIGGHPLTMPELDAVLFADYSVVGFQAAVSNNASGDCLTINVRTTGTADFDLMRTALNVAIPQLASVNIQVESSPTVIPVAGKRRICDSRSR